MLACCMLVVLTTACGNPKLKNGEEIVGSINGKEVSAEELYDTMKKNYGYSELVSMFDEYIVNEEIPTTDELKKEAQDQLEYYRSVAQQMYNMELLDYLSAQGLVLDKEEDFLDVLLTQIKTEDAIEKYVADGIKEDELKTYYDENYSEKITARHILIQIESSDKDGKDALKTANKIIDELKKTDKDKLEDKFIELAKEYSDDGSYQDGGLLDPFMSGDVVKEFWDGTTALKDGEYTVTPVKSDFGYHIILRKSTEDKPSFDDAKEEIIDKVVAKKLGEDQYLQYTAMVELRKKYKLKINDSVMKDAYQDYLDSLEDAKKNDSNEQ